MNIFQVAINMENDLERFYREQAEKNKDNELHTVFTLLANEEEKHAEILKKNTEKIVLDLEDSDIVSEVKPIFKNIADLSSDIKELPSQLDAYHLALEKEEESIVYYGKLYDEAKGDHSKTVIKFLLEQEKKHRNLLEDLITLVKRPEEWVEDAEFGLREEY